MASWKILTIMCIATVYADSKWYLRHKRETTSSICDPVQNNTNKVQCFCGRTSREPTQISNADCYQTDKNVSPDDASWGGFNILQNVTKLTLTNTRGVALNFIPTNALKHTKYLLRLDVKYCNIERIEPFAFANLTHVKDITLRDNQVRVLAPNSFAHHPSLKTLSLDQNNIAEINRDVFVDLPLLEQLFLTGNKITTIHDRAFVHLTNLKELELDKNSIFSLNSETFSGLRNLEKLELSGNSLEVIGDNTFLPLVRLHFLNLGENKIQMLDEKAFNGLSTLQFLSLPSNKISTIENKKVFEPLKGLSSLSLKDNEIRLIRPEAIAPILSNFYKTAAQLILDGNHLSCDCSLDVFQPLINKTQNERLKLEIQNLQCYPSDEIKQKWDRIQEVEKSTGQVFEDVELPENSVYEYYDEAELNGTLFYFDMRHLLNCSGEERPQPTETVFTTQMDKSTTPVQISDRPTKATSPVIIIPTTKPVQEKNIKIGNKGTLDLSASDPITPDSQEPARKKASETGQNEIAQDGPIFAKDERRKDKKDNVYTTSRLATVSAKPIDQKGFYDHDMASDEAKPDRIKAHRSVQEEVKEPKHKVNSSSNVTSVPMLILMILCFRVFL